MQLYTETMTIPLLKENELFSKFDVSFLHREFGLAWSWLMTDFSFDFTSSNRLPYISGCRLISIKFKGSSQGKPGRWIVFRKIWSQALVSDAKGRVKLEKQFFLFWQGDSKQSIKDLYKLLNFSREFGQKSWNKTFYKNLILQNWKKILKTTKINPFKGSDHDFSSVFDS